MPSLSGSHLLSAGAQAQPVFVRAEGTTIGECYQSFVLYIYFSLFSGYQAAMAVVHRPLGPHVHGLIHIPLQ